MLGYFGKEVAECLQGADLQALQEVRVRVGRPLIARINAREKVYPYNITGNDIREIIERISGSSLYAFESQLREGYITLPGGHRVGVCGQVLQENGAVQAWRHIAGVNFRVAHEMRGCADAVLPQITQGGQLLHTMIISPPGCGKTTLLRDIVRQLSDGGSTVGLADERSEVAGCYNGVPQLDVGMRTDTIDACPKPVAMVMLLRSMSPDIIAVDELGSAADIHAVDAVLNAGVRLLCTAHGHDVADIQENPALASLVARGIFSRFVVLDAPGSVREICNFPLA